MGKLADALELSENDRESFICTSVAPSGARHAAPRYSDPLVGRSRELEQITALVRSGRDRLVLLTGPGGVGKTRIAAAAASAIYPRSPSRVRWVSVPSSSSPAGLTAALTEALGFDPQGDLATAALRPPERRLLLVIDGADEQLDTVTRACQTLLGRTSRLRLIVTSRHRLRVPGAVPVEVKPLTPPVLVDGGVSQVEETLLARLSVFPDDFTHRGASALYGSEAVDAAVDETLSLLVSKSLVLRQDDVDGAARFRLLPVVRQWAQKRLAGQSDAHDVHRLHAAHLRREVAQPPGDPAEEHRRPWLDRVDREGDNLQAAFGWCVAHDPVTALEMVGNLWPWWRLRGRYAQGRSWAAQALAHGRHAPAPLRAPVLAVAGQLALAQSDYEQAQAHVHEGLDLYSAAGDSIGVAWSLAVLGSIAKERGEYTVAAQLHKQALVLGRRAADQQLVGAQLTSLCQIAWLRGDFTQADDLGRRALDTVSQIGDQHTMAEVTTDLGVIARLRGDLAGADVLLRQGHEARLRVGDREGAAWALHQLAVVNRLRGMQARALEQQTASLAEHRALGNRWRMTMVLDELAVLALGAADAETAASHLGAADRLRGEIAASLPPAQQPLRDRAVTTTRALLGTTYRPAALAGMARSSA